MPKPEEQHSPSLELAISIQQALLVTTIAFMLRMVDEDHGRLLLEELRGTIIPITAAANADPATVLVHEVATDRWLDEIIGMARIIQHSAVEQSVV